MRRTILPALRRQTALGPRIYWRGLSTGLRNHHIPTLSNVNVLTRCGAVPDAATRTVGVVATDEIAADFAQRAAAGGHTLRVALGPGAPDGMPHSNHSKQHARVVTVNRFIPWPQTCSLLRVCNRSIRWPRSLRNAMWWSRC